MKSYFTDALNISDFEVLTAIAVAVGLDGAEALSILESAAFAEEVRIDEAQAHSRKINGVPYFLFNEKEVVNGAQSVETFVAVIEGLK